MHGANCLRPSAGCVAGCTALPVLYCTAGCWWRPLHLALRLPVLSLLGTNRITQHRTSSCDDTHPMTRCRLYTAPYSPAAAVLRTCAARWSVLPQLGPFVARSPLRAHRPRRALSSTSSAPDSSVNSSGRPCFLFLVGGPCAGKGTQSRAANTRVRRGCGGQGGWDGGGLGGLAARG